MKQFLVSGQDKSGKTTLIQKWKSLATAKYNQSSIEQLSSNTIITLNGENIQLVDSETGNGSITNFQIQKISGAFLIFDLSNPKSILELAQFNQELKNQIQMVPIIILGNKFDLKDKSFTYSPAISDMAQKLNVPYFNVSGLSGLQCQQALDKMIGFIKSFQPIKNQGPITNGGGQHKGCCLIF